MSTCFDNSLGVNSKFASLADLLSYRASKQSEQTAYIFIQKGKEIGRITYGELEQRAQVLAVRLQSFEPGERALLLYPPGLEFISAFFGCLYAGIIAVPTYPLRRKQNLSKLKAIAMDAGAKIALTDSSLFSDLTTKLGRDPELARIHWLATDSLDGKAGGWQKPVLDSDTLAFLQYTSGSTGIPKGVMVSHGNLLHNSSLIYQCFECDCSSRGLIWLPPYHDMGLIGGILQPLYGGFPVTLMSPMDFLQKPFRWLQAISTTKATISGGPNFAYDACIQKVTPKQLAELDLSSWEVAFTGAEQIRAETLSAFAAKFEPCGFRKEAFLPCYGMAETTLMVTGELKSALPVEKQLKEAAIEQNQVVPVSDSELPNLRKIVGCGRSFEEQKIAIAHPESLTTNPPNRIGEIWVSSTSVAQGYWQRPEETQQTFKAYLADTKAGPFLRTGDLGFMLDGELFVTGRLKELIIIRGNNHYPQDIEATVVNSHSALQPNGSAAFAVEVKGQEKLVVVQEVKRSYLRQLDVEKALGNIRQAVSMQHDLQVYTTVLVKPGSIAKTSSGKIRRYACRSDFITGKLDIVRDWSENPQGKAEFLHLQNEVESMLQKLSAHG